MQDREARRARRLERERSLSPEKTSTPLSLRSQREYPPSAASALSSPRAMTPTSRPSTRDEMPTSRPSTRDEMPTEGVRAFPTTPSSRPTSPPASSHATPSTIADRIAERSPSPPKASPSAAMPTRAGTLSWQRRPQSGSVRGRPLSMVATATENSASRSPQRTAISASKEEAEPSRQQIAESLGAKDPTWFKQTADRGLGSAAYRKSKEEASPDMDTSMGRRHLPGLMKDDKADAAAEMGPPSESVQSTSTSRFGSVRDSTLSSRFSTISTASEQSRPESKSPLPTLESQKFPPSLSSSRPTSSDGEQLGLGRTMSTTQTRLSGERSPSPTKGMGGFVQSAMLKRTDSVNKRWSAQGSTGLARADSTVSMRSGYGSFRNGAAGVASSHSMPRLEGQPLELKRGNSSEAPSRPTSSHSTLSNMTALPETDPSNTFVKPALPLHSRSKSVASLRHAPIAEAEPQGFTSPPMSPSKRWSRSPTKASWLESALARPESPKPAVNQQPSWMTDLHKAKQQRNSAESTLSDAEIMTATAKSMKPAVVEKPVSFGPGMLKRSESSNLRAEESMRNITPPTKPKPVTLTAKSAPATPALQQSPPKEEKLSEAEPESKDAKDPSPEPIKSPSGSIPAKASLTSPSITSPKPKPATPPKKDFRSNLKPRQISAEAGAKDQPEFLSAFGKLKRTQQERYVAPDLLKNNILRGKAGLAASAGPQKSERRDELKESLLQKKEEMKAKQVDGTTEELRRSPSKLSQTPAPSLPEALMKKRQLGRTDSLRSTNAPEPRRDITPEALSRHRTLKGKPKIEPPRKPKFEQAEKQVFTPTEPEKPVVKAEPEQQAPLPVKVEKKDAPASSKFADRFNPSLAGLLARGPPTQASGPSPRSTSPVPSVRSSRPAVNADSAEPGEGAALTHMTKNRAKGPKRRKPNAKNTAPELVREESKPQPITVQKRPEPITVEKRMSAQLVKPSDVLPSSPTTKMPLQPAPKSAAARAVSISMSPARSEQEKEKPATPTKSASLSLKESPRQTTPKRLSSQLASPSKPAPPSASRKPSTPVRSLPVETTTPGPSISEPESPAVRSLRAREPADADKENSNGSAVKNRAATWGMPRQASASKRSSPIALPTKKDEEAAMKAAGLLSSSPLRYKAASPTGLGITTQESPKGQEKTDLPLSPPSSAGLPPKPTKSSRVVSGAMDKRLSSRGEHFI